ncbi:hypothetical protein BJV74DRAFT_322710 [Russula compacta]|nr:hypothetical protein BJV74DRAFT_322710 [Russula compacta]
MDTVDQLSKRRLTHDPRAPQVPSPPDLVSPDLNLRLQNIGSRIRRSVSEGYATHRFSHTSIQTERQGLINDAAIFRSANDTLHAVYSQFTSPNLAPSDRKRVRSESTIDERDEHPEGSTDDDAGMQSNSVITANDLACSRPIKSLRRTPRTFGQTKSLPAVVFGSSGGEQDQTCPDADLQEEEDWSASAFSGDSFKTETLA